MNASVTIGGMTFAATSIDVKQCTDRKTFYREGAPVGMTRGVHSFTVEASGEDFDAWARIIDAFALPESMDLTLTFAGEEPFPLRVLRDVKPEADGGRIVINYPVFRGPRLADGRWSPREIGRNSA